MTTDRFDEHHEESDVRVRSFQSVGIRPGCRPDRHAVILAGLYSGDEVQQEHLPTGITTHNTRLQNGLNPPDKSVPMDELFPEPKVLATLNGVQAAA